MENVFTFWEGVKPAYIELCMNTWQFPVIVLNYDNLHEYTDFDIENAKRFTMPQIADCVRTHVLRDNGGYWLDADTIMLSDKLPDANIMGNPQSRTNTIGFLHTKAHSDMYEKWAKHQDRVIADPNSPYNWDIMGNSFTDMYVRLHDDIKISPLALRWAETYIVQGVIPRNEKYKICYFEKNYELKDFLPTDMLMLHNSWTPQWYKKLSREEVLSYKCTMSNILKEILIL